MRVILRKVFPHMLLVKLSSEFWVFNFYMIIIYIEIYLILIKLAVLRHRAQFLAESLYSMGNKCSPTP